MSQIDSETLKRRFIEGEKHVETGRLKGSVRSKLTRMVRLNGSRMSLMEKLQKMIDEYNAGAINVEIFFDKLLVLARELNEEEKNKHYHMLERPRNLQDATPTANSSPIYRQNTREESNSLSVDGLDTHTVHLIFW